MRMNLLNQSKTFFLTTILQPGLPWNSSKVSPFWRPKWFAKSESSWPNRLFRGRLVEGASSGKNMEDRIHSGDFLQGHNPLLQVVPWHFCRTTSWIPFAGECWMYPKKKRENSRRFPWVPLRILKVNSGKINFVCESIWILYVKIYIHIILYITIQQSIDREYPGINKNKTKSKQWVCGISSPPSHKKNKHMSPKKGPFQTELVFQASFFGRELFSLGGIRNLSTPRLWLRSN